VEKWIAGLVDWWERRARFQRAGVTITPSLHKSIAPFTGVASDLASFV
jgi:hypothetical protein